MKRCKGDMPLFTTSLVDAVFETVGAVEPQVQYRPRVERKRTPESAGSVIFELRQEGL